MLSYSDSNAKVGKRIQKTNGIRGTESGHLGESRIRAVRVPKSGLYGSPNPGITKSSESGIHQPTSEKLI